jgi:hypothetical protein
MLPGVPHEMEFLVKHRIIPKLISSVDLPKIYYRYIDTYSMGESFIAQRIEPLLNNMPDEITLSYLPSAFQVTLRLSSTEEFKAQTDQYADIISDVLSQITIQKSNRDIFQYFNKVLANAPYTVSVWDEFTMGYWYFLVSEADFFTPAKIKYFLNSSYTKSDIEDESACLHIYVSKPTIDEVKKTLNVTLEFKNNHVHWQKNIDLFYNKKNNKNAIAKAICFYSIAYLNSDI